MNDFQKDIRDRIIIEGKSALGRELSNDEVTYVMNNLPTVIFNIYERFGPNDSDANELLWKYIKLTFIA